MKFLSDYKGIIFDLDGTLAESTQIWVNISEDWAKSKNLEFTPDFRNIAANMFFSQIAHFSVEYFKLPQTPESVMDEWAQLILHRYATSIGLKKGAYEFIKKQHENGVKLAIATSCFRSGCEAFLANHGLIELFEGFAYSDEVGKNKTNPDIYLLAANRLGLEPTDCIVFEDIYPALKGVRAANMRFVAVFDEDQEDWDKLTRESDFYINTYEELL